MPNTEQPAKIKAKVKMGARVIPRNPIGPDGKPRTEAEMQPYDLETQAEQVIEIDYDQAVSLFGQEQADLLFKKGVKNGD